MRVIVDVSADRIRLPISRDLTTRAVRATLRAEKVADAMLSVTFVANSHIARLNTRHLGHRGTTDVISFGLHRERKTDPIVGDIYIAPDVARVHARANHTTLREELLRLIVHGTLHVLGHDHPIDSTRELAPMWATQERIVRRLTKAAPR